MARSTTVLKGCGLIHKARCENGACMKKSGRIIKLALITPLALFCSHCFGAAVKDMPSGPDTASFPNPERGWYHTMTIKDLSAMNFFPFKKDNVTLVLFEADLGAYLNRELDSAILSKIDHAFALARLAGLSVIFRAAYDYTGKNNPDPADITIILGHIAQLKPVFYKNEDVLFNIQAGFLGPWGEWHHSHFGEPIKPEYQKIVADALLAASPPSVTVAVRRPVYVRTIAGDEPLTAEEAFSGSVLARMAFHNDALMSDKTDMNTYSDINYTPEDEFAWIENHTRYTPFIGETCKVSSFNNPDNAIRFLDLMNATSINIEYHPDVLKKWQKARHNGISVFDYIGIKLGYRFELKRTVLGGDTRPGGKLSLDLELINTGFGNLLKAKKFEIVLKNGSRMYRAAIAEDPRFWNKNEPVSRVYYFQLPSDLTRGDWDVYLGLSSTFESLANNPAYSVRFANADVWDAKLGLNKIGIISLAAANAAKDDGSKKEFKQINP